jgi:hypothetical protein
MSTIVCTVFEGHYHKGVAALVNSLVANAYEGEIWVGYKGDLPNWAKTRTADKGVKVMSLTDKQSLHFVRFDDKSFLPYTKPNFMLDILNNYRPDTQTLAYFDCDIIVKCRFSYFEEWAEAGVALCEDVSSPLPASHPLRFQWAEYFKKYGIKVENKDHYYVNGGFTALKRSAKGFLETWKHVQDLMLDELKEVKSIGLKDRTYLFYRTDQDALNIAKDISPERFSIADGTAMDLSNFGYIMSHALGGAKPWQKNWLMHVLKKGQRPTITDRLFMQHIDTPLSIYSPFERWRRNLNLKTAIVAGRLLT